MTDIKEGPFIGDKSIREILGTAPEPPKWVSVERCSQCSGPDCYIIREGEYVIGVCRRNMPADWVPEPPRAPEPSSTVRSTATEKACDHSGIGLPGCEACDPNTDRNQDRRRRGESPTCIDCGGRGELDGEVPGRRWCQACQVTFGWMERAPKEDPDPYVWCGRSDPAFPGHICGLRVGHALPCRMEAVP